jgi:serine protease Do
MDAFNVSPRSNELELACASERPAQRSLHEWQLAVEQARSFLGDDPMTASYRLAELDRELRATLAAYGGKPELTQLAAYVSWLLNQARGAADRWLAECAEREQRFRTRERAQNRLPVEALRRPWPASPTTVNATPGFTTLSRAPEAQPPKPRNTARRWRRVLTTLKHAPCWAWLSVLIVLGACERPPRVPGHDAGSQVSAGHPSGEASASHSAALLPDGRSIANVAAKVTPSVVNVFSERKIDVDRGMSPFFADPFFRFFFERPQGPSAPAGRREQSLGSGVIVSSDGVIITNNHVVADADEIRAALKDGREFKARLLGADRESDVAVLRIDDAKDLPAIEVADSSQMRIGDLVLAIGNPFGVGQTVTMGIVSAVGRANMGITDYEDFIQTDAAINPGNSGGALVNMDGKLVGINTAIISRTGGYQGIGFAIPSNMAIQVKDAIVTHGKVVRGWLGVSLQDLTEQLANGLNVGLRSGVLVADVTGGGPAAKAGIQRGDIITAIDGVKMEDSRHLRNSVALGGAGRKVRIDVLRDGKAKSFEVTLEEAKASARKAKVQAENSGIFAGVSVQDLTPSLREQFDIPGDVNGVVVSEVERNSSAAELGLRPGDLIVRVNRKDIGSVEDFRKAAHDSERRALVLVYRDGSALFLSLSR